MRIGIGIDFGTTNSTAAVFDGERLSLVALETGNPIMPSATYIDRELQTMTGQNAIDRYIHDNTGRTVELIPEVVAEISQFVEAGEAEQPTPMATGSHDVLDDIVFLSHKNLVVGTAAVSLLR